MVEFDILVAVLVSHFIGDFILQSGYMAKNKSKSNLVLGRHVLVYGLPFMWLGFWFYAITIVLHFIVDFVTSRITSYLYSRSTHWFFVVIGFDQLLHSISLIGVYLILLDKGLLW